MNPLVIIHGWSDSSESFQPLADALKARLNIPVSIINMANWESQNDDITYNDLVTQLNVAWDGAGLSREPLSVDVITHSTGGILIRNWIFNYFNVSPIKHLIQLAPANFGSTIAASGESYLGRILKGWNLKNFMQIGERILKGLELGSPFTRDLALKDRFGDVNFYDKGGTLTTVLVGNTGFSGISAAANENGSDGTVRVSTANLNCVYLQVDFSDPDNPIFTQKKSNGVVAFKVLDGINHLTIRDPNNIVINSIIDGLSIDDDGFYTYCESLDSQNKELYNTNEQNSDPYRWGYSNISFFVDNQYGDHITDYFIEFFNDENNIFEELFHKDIIQNCHIFTDDSSFRAMLIDVCTLNKAISAPDFTNLKISLIAQPEYSSNDVGYSTFTDDQIGAIVINKDQASEIFIKNMTVLIDIKLKKQQNSSVFSINVY